MSPKAGGAALALSISIALVGAGAPLQAAAAPPVDPGAPNQKAPNGQADRARGEKARTDRPRDERPRDDKPRDDKPRDDKLRDEAMRDEGFRRGGGPPLTPEMVERVVAVAYDVSPELGKQLDERRQASPEEMTQAMRQNARRLIALAVLKERNKELYDTRVQDLRLQMELHSLGAKYMAAKAASDQAAIATLADEISAKTKRQVESDLKARGQELKALADQLDAMRIELKAETEQFDARVAERIEAVKSGQPLKVRLFPGEGPPRGGEGRGLTPPEKPGTGAGPGGK